ncbi:hypothetical protein [Acinetobacter tandoii]|uniref:Uncharacterized protein n=1 Tax=Acinetobacter tandoii DSM 14970 = CIP 107469 TaxID=1120927 RepID=R9B931_9GAMM|nr:hypothetical protein [Acinetobacter tandoii]EOR10968.1 hypothetical protein I593_00450 [Acinetobacter tandoii DSM 14970 = CIP 107469]
MQNNSHLLNKYNIVKQGAVFKAFQLVLENSLDIQNLKPHEQLRVLWKAYKDSCPNNNNINGKIFEAIIATVMLENGIGPIFSQANVVFVPNVNFDLIVYSKEFGPISISAKTSLRERYKQADLEAVSLKYVHRKARCYLVTMDKPEAIRLEKKLKEGDLLGIDDIVLGDEASFDEMIEFLGSISLEKPKAVEIIKSFYVYDVVQNDK